VAGLTLSRRSRAPEGRRTPRRFAHAGPLAYAAAFWSAPVLWRFSPERQSATCFQAVVSRALKTNLCKRNNLEGGAACAPASWSAAALPPLRRDGGRHSTGTECYCCHASRTVVPIRCGFEVAAWKWNPGFVYKTCAWPQRQRAGALHDAGAFAMRLWSSRSDTFGQRSSSACTEEKTVYFLSSPNAKPCPTPRTSAR
jgi:hypothetical protein